MSQEDAAFNRFIDFIAKMIEKYSDETVENE